MRLFTQICDIHIAPLMCCQRQDISVNFLTFRILCMTLISIRSAAADRKQYFPVFPQKKRGCEDFTCFRQHKTNIPFRVIYLSFHACKNRLFLHLFTSSFKSAFIICPDCPSVKHFSDISSFSSLRTGL